MGNYVLRALKPRSKVAIIGGLPGSINAKARSDGYREAIASANMTLTALAWGDWEREPGQAAAHRKQLSQPARLSQSAGTHHDQCINLQR
ncbi:hypothetical protein [Chromobacterium haemolyticum]|uniref:hypothetical protein n=1 Tax=Chromobacterium TaxID=535 RepID=UPI00193C2DC5